MVLAPVFDRIWQEQRKPEIFGKSPGGVKTQGGYYEEVDESPRAGGGFGGPNTGIPDNYFSAKGTGHTPRSSTNFSPRSSENFSPRSSENQGPFGRASDADEKSNLGRKRGGL